MIVAPRGASEVAPVSERRVIETEADLRGAIVLWFRLRRRSSALSVCTGRLVALDCLPRLICQYLGFAFLRMPR